MKNETYITARYAETDQMGIIHHSVYPVWFEVGRTNFIRMLGISYSELEREGIMLPLSRLECHYLCPVHYEEEVLLETRVEKLTASRIQFSYRVLLDGTLMAEGSTTHGFVNADTLKPLNMKKYCEELYLQLAATMGENHV